MKRLLMLAAVITAAMVTFDTGSATRGWASPGATPGAAAPAALAVVDMEATVKAAQIDPRRADHTLTHGARSSVLAVERALNAKHLLEQKWVDGYFGTQTIAAYAAYQQSLGLTGLDATGLPDKTTLTKLGVSRFVVTRVVAPGRRFDWGNGRIVNTRTGNMLAEAGRLLGRDLVLDQGSYNPGGDPTSKGTHDGGGTVDVSVQGMDDATRLTVVTALRQVGFAAWLRNPSQGNWPWHIHAVAISDTDQSSSAQHQVGDYYLGLNGLANRGPDDGPRAPIHTWEEYQRLP